MSLKPAVSTVTKLNSDELLKLNKYNVALTNLSLSLGIAELKNQLTPFVTNGTQWFFNSAMPNDSNKFTNATLYLFNFNNSSEYSFVTVESAGWNDSIEDLVGEQGGAVHTVAETNDGIELLWESGSNFASGSKVILYGLKK